MQDKIFVYRPYRMEAIIGTILKYVAVPLLIVSGICLSTENYAVFCFLLAMGVLILQLAEELSKRGHIVLCVDDRGICVNGYKGSPYKAFSWNDFSYSYCVRNIRNFPFLILSAKKLTKKQQNKLMNGFRVYTDEALVIYLDQLQDTSAMRDYVMEQVVNRTGGGLREP